MRLRHLPVIASLLAATFLWIAVPRSWSQNIVPGDLERRIAKNFFNALPEQHMLKLSFDQQMAEAAVDNYITHLDGWKVYFRQEDIEEFQRRKPGLADQLASGDVSLVFDIFRRCMQRISEAESVCKEFLQPGKLEFSTPEMFVVNLQDREYPPDLETFREQWRQLLKYQLLTKKADPNRKAFNLQEACNELLTERLRTFRNFKRMPSQEILELFLNQVADLYDRNTSYTSPMARENFDIQQRGNLTGVGMAITSELTVSSIVAGGPAEKSGQFQPGDAIVGVGQGASGPLTDTTPLLLSELVALIRGAEGTTVRVSIKRPGEARARTVSLQRARVVVPQAKVVSRIIPVERLKLGYLEIPSFYRDAAPGDNAVVTVSKALEGFKQQKADCVLLDLRNCSGGYIDQALALSGLFTGKGKIYQSRNQQGEVLATENDSTEMLWNKPLVILVGRSTASGAELLCGAIQDYRRGLIIGDDVTNGHGLIASLNDLPDGTGMLKVTTSKFYRVSGEGILQLGVTPDVLVPSVAVVESRESPEKSQLVLDKVPALSISSQNMLAPEMVLKLRAASRDRRLLSPAFQQLQAAIDWKRDQVATTVESLQEDAFLAGRRDSPISRLKELPTGDAEIFLKEACAIAAEYVGLAGTRVASSLGSARSASTGTPETVRQRTIANQREAARQAVEQLEEKLQRVNAQVASAQGIVEAAGKARDATMENSAKRILAEQACRAAENALGRVQESARNTQSELDTAKSKL